MRVFYAQDTSSSIENETSFVGRLFEQARKLPDTVPQAIRQELATLSAEINGGSEELKKVSKKEADKLMITLKEKAKNGLQKYAREGKTAELKNNKKFEKLLSHASSFDGIRAGDVLKMRASGENIANFLLTNDEGNEIDLTNTNADSFKNKSLLVNFGANKNINASIGLGDILPYEVKKVEVTKPNGEKIIGTLGSNDSRAGRRERVGYYDEKGKYIAIYNQYSIKIIETGAVSTEEKNKYEAIQVKQLENIRTNEMVEFLVGKNGLKKLSTEEAKTILTEEFKDSSDTSLFDTAIKKFNSRIERGIHTREAYKDGIGSRDKFVGKFGWYLRDIITKDFPGVPPHMLVNLFDKESSPRGSFDPTALNATTKAYGLGQMTPDTWDTVEEKTNKKYDRSSPYDQIYASAAYLDFIMNLNNCNIQDAIVYYHTGPYVRVYIDKNNLGKLEDYKSSNPAIAKGMSENSWNGYMEAARKYYTEDATLLTSLDLSKTGTEIATQLGDYVMSTSLPETGSGSCGQAVGILLNRFGIEALPQTGRDGKNWDDILEPRVRNGQFKKVAIKHPSEASSGAILVYDGSGQLGSNANKNYGHVEIKGSDGKYYSYYEGERAGGSASTNEKDPDNYRKLTGFVGYAYYPIIKSA
ncbi:transglycosylase SLT domain-containing protein [Candidatus Gracilibacteria bacterium]|nr:transglycosylase SLT domain-containing protein [Candidatus Gracilibacteria bacterium]